MSRPYRADSILDCPAPAQSLTHQFVDQWLNRIGAYWTHGNAMVRDVARALATHAGPDGRIFPSIASIAERGGIDSRTVTRWLPKLVRVGFIERIRRRTAAGQTSNAYRLTVPSDASAPEPAPVPEQSVDLSNDKTQSLEAGQGVSLDTKPPPAGKLGWLAGLVERGKRLLEMDHDPEKFQREAQESAQRQLQALLPTPAT